MVRPWPPRRYRHATVPSSRAEWLRLPNSSLSTLSELYIENLKQGEFFLYIFIGITRGMVGAPDWRFLRLSSSPVSKHIAQLVKRGTKATWDICPDSSSSPDSSFQCPISGRDVNAST